MIKLLFITLLYLVFGCKNATVNNFNEKTQNYEMNIFFKDFVQIKKNEYNFSKIKSISYGDSLSFKYWVEESGVDINFLKKYFDFEDLNLENSISFEKPDILSGYEIFDFEKYEDYKAKNPRSNFNEYFAIHFKKCELLMINFVIFNREKNKILIYHASDCSKAQIEVYIKNNNEWILLKKISEISQ
jgi:hypothetical protein